MIEVFSKKCRILSFLHLVLTSVFLQAQDKNTIPDVEKVYLHTDRSTYFEGEDLWYKAYNVKASNNLLFDNSNILYVELISSDSKIIARNKTKLEKGLGHGDFQLQDSLGVKPGIYQLRAYTNWNRNFGEDFIFKKEIEVVDVFESKVKTKTDLNKSIENSTSKKATQKQNTFRIDFFPEGGSLLENVATIVGFKAIEANGKPIEIKGEIYDSDNELITAFESVHDGMGKLQILPIEGKSYYAKIKNPRGEELRVDLSKVLKQGYSLAYRTLKGKNIVSINTNKATLQQNPNANLTVCFKSKGIQYFETTQTLAETNLSFELPKDKIPEGISQITLFENNKPQSERLIYFEKENDLEVDLSTDNDTYEPKEKTIVYVSSKSKEGVPLSASFSLSVTDTNGVEEPDYETNICSYFLMESDIKGKVYHSGYYFDRTNPKRLEHLDNLLLTQGWRDFIWKTIPQVDKSNFYKAERGFIISGIVKQLFGDKPLINNNLTLSLMDQEKINAFNAITDSIGHFQFENLLFTGMTNMYLNNRNDKDKFRGEIVLDSIERNPVAVKFKKELIILPEIRNSIVENVYNKFTALGVNPENMLKEIEVKAKNKRKGLYEYSFVVDKKEANKFYNFLDYLNAKLSANVPKLSESGMSYKVIIDNFPMTDAKELFSLSPENVIKVEVVSGEALKAIYKQSTVVTIFTNIKNGGQRIKTDPMYFIKKRILGFYTARIFYSPNLEDSNVKVDNITNLRNTIYWNPLVHPDDSGEISVDYYNTNVETKVKVALEGITGSGIPVVKNTYYTIKR